jgi:DNA polymerase-3 subunit delta
MNHLEEFRRIQQDILNKRYKPVYILSGTESYYIDLLTQHFENDVISEEEFKEFNLNIVYGKDTTAEGIISIAKSYPMMAERRLLIIKEAQSFKDLDLLESYILKPVASTILVICYKHGKIDSRKKALKNILSAKNIEVFVSDKLNENEIIDWIAKQFNRRKIKIDLKAAFILYELMGDNLSLIYNEIEKMTIALPPGSEVRAEEISSNIGSSKEYNAFELQAALINKNIERSYKIINYFSLPSNQKEIPMIIGALHSFFVKILIYHIEFSKGKIKRDGDVYNYFKVFDLNEFIKATKKFHFKKSQDIIHQLLITDLKFKGVDHTSSDRSGLLKELVFKILH